MHKVCSIKDSLHTPSLFGDAMPSSLKQAKEMAKILEKQTKKN